MGLAIDALTCSQRRSIERLRVGRQSKLSVRKCQVNRGRERLLVVASKVCDLPLIAANQDLVGAAEIALFSHRICYTFLGINRSKVVRPVQPSCRRGELLEDGQSFVGSTHIVERRAQILQCQPAPNILLRTAREAQPRRTPQRNTTRAMKLLSALSARSQRLDVRPIIVLASLLGVLHEAPDVREARVRPAARAHPHEVARQLPGGRLV